MKDQQEYEVEGITEEQDGQFRIKWKDYKKETWESKRNLTNCTEALRNWITRKDSGRN